MYKRNHIHILDAMDKVLRRKDWEIWGLNGWKENHRTDSLRKIRACSLQVLKVFVSDSCLYHYLKHSKCPQKFRKSMATYGVNVKGTDFYPHFDGRWLLLFKGSK